MGRFTKSGIDFRLWFSDEKNPARGVSLPDFFLPGSKVSPGKQPFLGKKEMFHAEAISWLQTGISRERVWNTPDLRGLNEGEKQPMIFPFSDFHQFPDKPCLSNLQISEIQARRQASRRFPGKKMPTRRENFALRQPGDFPAMHVGQPQEDEG